MCRVLLLFLSLGLGATAGCGRDRAPQAAEPISLAAPSPQVTIDPLQPIANPRSAGEKIVNGAIEQVVRGVRYMPGYRVLNYPGGDPPAEEGVCTDILVRALRKAGYDLQSLIHEDMKDNFAKYPQEWGLRGPDPHIDHRRVPNQMRFLQRHGTALTTRVANDTLKDWQPGDLVYWRLSNGLLHCGVVSDFRSCTGVPHVIHNLSGARQEDCLTAWKILGHFRYP